MKMAIADAWIHSLQIDKKSHRSKDNLTSMSEVLQNLSSRPSTFHSHLTMYKVTHSRRITMSFKLLRYCLLHPLYLNE